GVEEVTSHSERCWGMTFLRMRSRRMSWADASSQKSGLSIVRTSTMPVPLYPTPLGRAARLVLEFDARLAQLLSNTVGQGEVPRLLRGGALVDQSLDGVRRQFVALGASAQVAAGRL